MCGEAIWFSITAREFLVLMASAQVLQTLKSTDGILCESLQKPLTAPTKLHDRVAKPCTGPHVAGSIKKTQKLCVKILTNAVNQSVSMGAAASTHATLTFQSEGIQISPSSPPDLQVLSEGSLLDRKIAWNMGISYEGADLPSITKNDLAVMRVMISHSLRAFVFRHVLVYLTSAAFSYLGHSCKLPPTTCLVALRSVHLL